jgi:hypothetical protein
VDEKEKKRLEKEWKKQQEQQAKEQERLAKEKEKEDKRKSKDMGAATASGATPGHPPSIAPAAPVAMTAPQLEEERKKLKTWDDSLRVEAERLKKEGDTIKVERIKLEDLKKKEEEVKKSLSEKEILLNKANQIEKKLRDIAKRETDIVNNKRDMDKRDAGLCEKEKTLINLIEEYVSKIKRLEAENAEKDKALKTVAKSEAAKVVRDKKNELMKRMDEIDGVKRTLEKRILELYLAEVASIEKERENVKKMHTDVSREAERLRDDLSEREKSLVELQKRFDDMKRLLGPVTVAGFVERAPIGSGPAPEKPKPEANVPKVEPAKPVEPKARIPTPEPKPEPKLDLIKPTPAAQVQEAKPASSPEPKKEEKKPDVQPAIEEKKEDEKKGRFSFFKKK